MARTASCFEIVEVKRRDGTELYGPFTTSSEVARCLRLHAERDPGCLIEVRQLLLPAFFIIRQETGTAA